MIFNNPPKLAAASAVARYVQTDLYGWFRNLAAGLSRLSLVDNFEAFEVTGLTILAGETAVITNALPGVPSKRLIVRQVGNGVVSDGVWDSNILRLINNGSDTVTVSVIFYT